MTDEVVTHSVLTGAWWCVEPTVGCSKEITSWQLCETEHSHVFSLDDCPFQVWIWPLAMQSNQGLDDTKAGSPQEGLRHHTVRQRQRQSTSWSRYQHTRLVLSAGRMKIPEEWGHAAGEDVTSLGPPTFKTSQRDWWSVHTGESQVRTVTTATGSEWQFQFTIKQHDYLLKRFFFQYSGTKCYSRRKHHRRPTITVWMA